MAFKKNYIPWNKGKVFSKEKFPNYGMRGKIPWNKGLTKETDERVLKYSISGAKSQKGYHNSPQNEFKKGSKRIKDIRAKQILPVKDTSIEVKIQNFLKQLNIEYFTHQYMKIEHGYQCDILIPSLNMVIECDGDYWHKYPIGLEKDHLRTKELIEKGFKVLRLWECQIKPMNLNDFRRKLQ